MSMAWQAGRGQHELYRSLVELSPDAIVVVHDGSISFANAAAAALFGAGDAAQLVGRRSADLLTLSQDLSGVERALALDGHALDVEATLSRLSAPGTSAVQVVLRQGSGRARAEEERRDAEERLRLAIDSAQLAVLEWDLATGEIVFTGHDSVVPAGVPARLTRQELEKLVHHEDVASFRAAVSRAVRDGQPLDLEFRLQGGDGPARWISVRGTVLPAPSRRPRLSAVFANVTARRRAEEERERLLASERGARAAADEARGQVVDMLERITDAFVALDGAWRFTYVNRRAGELLGRRAAELLGKEIWSEFPQSAGQSFYHAYHRAAADQMSLYFVDRFPPRDLWLENRVYPSPEGLSIFLRDVTDERRKEQAFQNLVGGTAAATGADFFPVLVKHLAQALDVGFAFVTELVAQDPPRVRLLSSWTAGKWGTTYEYDTEGTPCHDVVTGARVVYRARGVCQAFPADRELARLGAEGYLAVPLLDGLGKPMGHLSVMDTGPIGSEAPARSVLFAFAARAAAELMRTRAEEGLERSLGELQALTARLQSVREEEGTRIAREIHDELGGLLTALKMDLWWLRKRAEAVEPGQRETFLARTQAMSGLLDTTIVTVQRISEELRPGALDELGLAAAAREHVEEFGRRTGLPAALDCGPLPELPSQLATALFRMLQELLTNVARHAAATRVAVTLREENGGILLTVSDDGRGIKPEELHARTSLGLLGMRERASLVSGTVHLEGLPGRGTTATVRVPLTPR